MAAVWLRCRAELRHRWRPLIALTVLVGLGSGVVLAAIAGARRTSTAFDRFVASTKASDAGVELDAGANVSLDSITRLPQVAAAARIGFVFGYPEQGFFPFAVSLDGHEGKTMNLPRVLEGRLPRLRAPNEIAVSDVNAQRLHVRVGDSLTLHTFAPDQATAAFDERTQELPEFGGPDVELSVVGIVRSPDDLALRGKDPGFTLLTPAFARRYDGRVLIFPARVNVRLRGGAAQVPEFRRAVEAAVRGPGASFSTTLRAREGVQDSLDVLADGLWIFSAVSALAALVALGVVVGRHASFSASDEPTLRALGMTDRQRVGAALLALAPAAIGGGVLGVLLAGGASPLLPIGLARRAEPDPGFRFDAPVLLIGLVGATAVVAGLAALITWRASLRAIRPEQPATNLGIAALVGRCAGRNPTSDVGVRMALKRGRGSTAVPVAPAMIGAVAGVLGVVAVLVFAGSLDRLAHTPARYGWGWDVNASDPDVKALRSDPDVGALARARFNVPMTVGDDVTSAIGIQPIDGDVFPTVVEGRAPVDDHEIVLGSDTLARLSRSIGDRVTISGPGGSRRVTIVGEGVFPSPDDPVALADGAALRLGALRPLGLADGTREGQSYEQHLVRWAPGVDRTAAERRLARHTDVLVPATPPEVDKLKQVGRLPEVLAAFLILLAVVAVGHGLVVGVHRRRRDLAVLETIGFVTRQVSATVAWQVTTIIAIGLLVGMPLGLIVGRFAWALVAGGLGVATDADVPVVALLLAVPVAVLVANVIAFVPGRIAARTRPAAVLRAE